MKAVHDSCLKISLVILQRMFHLFNIKGWLLFSTFFLSKRVEQTLLDLCADSSFCYELIFLWPLLTFCIHNNDSFGQYTLSQHYTSADTCLSAFKGPLDPSVVLGGFSGNNFSEVISFAIYLLFIEQSYYRPQFNFQMSGYSICGNLPRQQHYRRDKRCNRKDCRMGKGFH